MSTVLPNDPNKGGIYFGIDLSKGSYKVYASADSNCYQDSPKYDIKVEKDSLTQLNILLSKDPNVPNCIAPPGTLFPADIIDHVKNELNFVENEILDHASFHIGMNLFRGPYDDPNYNSDSLIDSVYLHIKNFYDEIKSTFNVYMGVRGYDPNSRKWYARFMDGTETTCSFDGDIFTIDKDNTYLFYLDIQDPNQKLKEIHLTFHGPVTESNGFNFNKGINLHGPSMSSIGLDSFKSLLEDPNIKDKISSVLLYNSQRGYFNAHYNIFGRPAADFTQDDIPQSVTDNGYIFYMEEALHGWKP